MMANERFARLGVLSRRRFFSGSWPEGRSRAAELLPFSHLGLSCLKELPL
jgi:hypothetical protein